MDNGVYADLEMLVAWKNEMETMNDSAVQVLDTLKGTIADLENYWDAAYYGYQAIESFLVYLED